MAMKRIGTGRGVSPAVLRGDTIYLAGQVADRAAGESVAAQTRAILAKIDRLLHEAGSDKSRLLMAHIRLADMATFAEMNVEWDAWVSEGQTPGRATVEAELASPEHAVEIAVIAAR